MAPPLGSPASSSPGRHTRLVVEISGSDFTTNLRVFPDSRGVTISYESSHKTEDSDSVEKQEAAKGIEKAKKIKKPKKWLPAVDQLILKPRHLKVTQVEMLDQTDHYNELVFEKEWLPLQEHLKFSCNVAFVESTLTQRGLLFLKLAPLPHARPVKTDYDVSYSTGDRRFTALGHGYPTVVLSYSGGRTGRITAMMDYQRSLRQYDPLRDGTFLSNTWGDRSQDSRISEAFLMKEIEAGARLGVDVVQVDDGWQKGMSGNSAFGKGAWGDFYKADPDFWLPHPERFPHGLKNVVDGTEEKGMKFGLWFGPDSTDDMKHWERDANVLLKHYREDKINYFKIDAVEVRTRQAEENLHRFYDKVQQESKGEVVFDADATAGIRPTYFGTLNVGPVFLENRYTDFHRYYPHHTLRNVWELAAYVDPVRLRMEFLNVTRNQEKYRNDPLAPALYSPDTLFASVMFTCPLGWFEVSNLPQSYFDKVSPLVKVWKQHRESIFHGHIIPIGEAPDGVAWTGLTSLSKDRKKAYGVVFRELNDSATWESAIPDFDLNSKNVTILSGDGSAEITEDGVKFELSKKLGYLFFLIE